MGLKKIAYKPFSIARPDDRGRITLGKLLTLGVSRFDIFINEQTGEVLLKPYKEIPANEAWLYQNPTALNLVNKGLKEAQAGKFSGQEFEETSWIDEIEDDE